MAKLIEARQVPITIITIIIVVVVVAVVVVVLVVLVPREVDRKSNELPLVPFACRR